MRYSRPHFNALDDNIANGPVIDVDHSGCAATCHGQSNVFNVFGFDVNGRRKVHQSAQGNGKVNNSFALYL